MKLPLVLLHGWGVSASIWNPILEPLKPHADVVLLELPGYGTDGDYSGDYSLDAIVAEVLARAPEKANWVGWSLGATVAMTAAIRHPQRFNRLQLISPTPCFSNQADWQNGTDVEPFNKLADDFDKDYSKAIGKFLLLQALMKDRSNIGDAKRLVRDLRSQLCESAQPTNETLQGGLEILRQTDLRSQLAELTVETQVIAGKDDQVVPCAASQFVFDHIPRAHSFHKLAAGHLPFLQEPAKYIELLKQFIPTSP